MSQWYYCGSCKNDHRAGQVCPRLRSIAPARRPEQSEVKAEPEIRSVPGDSRVIRIAKLTSIRLALKEADTYIRELMHAEAFSHPEHNEHSKPTETA